VKNTGKPYEALTEQVFARLLAQGNVCAKVERDVTIEGKSTKHQIDVTFEFVAGPVTYRTIVQCKDWASAVKQEQVLAFHAVLNDIPGQPRGIMVSRSGFQDGARSVAEHHRIQLYELREPEESDWNGLLRAIELNIIVRQPHFEGVHFVWDEPAIQAEMAVRKLPGVSASYAGPLSGMPLVTLGGAEIDADDILNALVPSLSGEGPNRVRHTFDEPVFAEVPDCAIARLPVAAIEASIRFTSYQEQVRVTLDHLIAVCFRDVLDGSVQFLDSTGGQVRVGRIIPVDDPAAGE
jgi:hypothetical protein